MNALDMFLKPVHMRNPSWRYNWAVYCAAAPQLPTGMWRKDRLLLDAALFLRDKSDKHVDPYDYISKYRLIYEAYLIYTHSNPMGGYRWIIEAMLTTGASDIDIAEQFPVDSGDGPEVIAIYRKLFYDIGPYLENDMAFMGNVLSTALSNQVDPFDCDYSWKVFAKNHTLPEVVDFFKFLSGGKLPKDKRKWFQEIVADRAAYHAYALSNNLRNLWDVQASIVVHEVSKNYVTAEGSAPPIQEHSAKAAKQLMDTMAMVMQHPDIERKIAANTDAIEPQSGFDYTLLTPTPQDAEGAGD